MSGVKSFVDRHWRVFNILFLVLTLGAGGSIWIAYSEGFSLIPSVVLTVCFFLGMAYTHNWGREDTS